jgi:hypothetical protein
MRLEDLLLQVRAGDMTFAEMVRASKKTWENHAQYIARRWRGPNWHGLEDLEQELLLGAWRAIWDYDPTVPNAPTIDRYVIWNAVDRAKKRQHKARAVRLHGNPDGEKSRFDMPAGSFSSGDITESMESPATQELHLGQIEHALSACRTRRERLAIRTLAQTGSVLHAASALYEDEGARRVLGVGSPRAAGRAVRRAVRDVAERVRLKAA